MLFNPRNIVTALLASATLAWMPAHAASGNANASLSNIQFRLLDLDLTDNITPSVTFSRWGGGSGYLVFYASDEGGRIYPYDESASLSFPTGGVSSRSGPDSMHVEAHINAVPGTLSASSFLQQQVEFTLSPSTRLLFSAEAETFMQNDGIDEARAQAIMRGRLSTEHGGVWGEEDFSTSLSSLDGQRKRLLQGAFDTGTSGGSGIMLTSVFTSFTQHAGISPVPEPETYGMLAAGLMVIGNVARRKTRRAARTA